LYTVNAEELVGKDITEALKKVRIDLHSLQTFGNVGYDVLEL
jgi:hypothetical protein